MSEQRTTYFVELLVVLVRLMLAVKEEYFQQRLHTKVCLLVSTFTYQQTTSDPKDILQTLDTLRELLADYGHLSIIDHTMLLETERNLLRLRLDFLRQPLAKKKMTQSQVSSISSQAIQQKPNLVGTKERIFNFIKISSARRTREIIEEFPVLSERTVIRSLKELTDQGLLEKKAENKAVFYSATK